MATVTFSPKSRRDPLDIGDYIAKDSPANARRFIDKLAEQCRRVGAAPIGYTSREDLAHGTARPVRDFLQTGRRHGAHRADTARLAQSPGGSSRQKRNDLKRLGPAVGSGGPAGVDAVVGGGADGRGLREGRTWNLFLKPFLPSMIAAE